MQYTVWTCVVVTVVATIITLSLESIPVIYAGTTEVTVESAGLFCQDLWCVFGWTSKEWFPVVISFGFFTGCICILGFNYAMKNISPLIFSSMNMLDPALTGLISWSVGLEGIPAAGVILGGTVVTMGIAVLTAGEQKRDEESAKPATDDSHGRYVNSDSNFKFQKLSTIDTDEREDSFTGNAMSPDGVDAVDNVEMAIIFSNGQGNRGDGVQAGLGQDECDLDTA
jgi:hypothetical protein